MGKRTIVVNVCIVYDAQLVDDRDNVDKQGECDGEKRAGVQRAPKDLDEVVSSR